MRKPELVLPAGDFGKLETALLFGADAIYAGGKEFSLRAFAGNLTLAEIAAGVKYAHQAGKKMYITVNILAHNRDINNLPPYLEQLAELEVDGLIIADLGVMGMAKTYAPYIPVTISTQANVTNYEAAALYREMGASRIVLARELNLEEIVEIKQRVDVQLEVFIHGAMCVSYSGRCLLSHYMTGRNANRGACAHPCRYLYRVVEEKRPGQYYPLEEDERGSFIFNSRDLCLLEYLPQLIDAGIDAFKIEGRMKSPLYVATTARVYKQALERYASTGTTYNEQEISAWLQELQGIATRPYTNGFIDGESPFIQDIDKQEVAGRYDFCGIVKSYDSTNKMIEIEQRANFGPGDFLEFMLPRGEIIGSQLTELFDGDGNKLDRARHPRQRVFFPVEQPVPAYSVLRRVGTQHEG